MTASFIIQGTITAKFRKGNNKTIVLTPTADYTAKHRDHKYAVAILCKDSDDQNTDGDLESKLFELTNTGTTKTEFTFKKSICYAASIVANSQTKVELEIEDKYKKERYEIIAFRFPVK